MTRILILDYAGVDPRLPESILSDWLARYEIGFSDATKPLQQQLQGASVVIDPGGAAEISGTVVDTAVREGVKLWQVITNGLDHVDVGLFSTRGLALANTPGPMSASALAEHALLLMLGLAKNWPESQNNLLAKVLHRPLNEELEGKVLGLIGFGASGSALGKRAHALGMHVWAIDVRGITDTDSSGILEFRGGKNDLRTVAANADYLSLHVPLTAKTHHMINADIFALMKKTAVLINVARGAIVEQEALVEALRNNGIRGAGLDVFEDEPLDPAHPLLNMNNVVATPHVAGETRETMMRRWEVAANNVDRIARGLEPRYEVTKTE